MYQKKGNDRLMIRWRVYPGSRTKLVITRLGKLATLSKVIGFFPFHCFFLCMFHSQGRKLSFVLLLVGQVDNTEDLILFKFSGQLDSVPWRLRCTFTQSFSHCAEVWEVLLSTFGEWNEFSHNHTHWKEIFFFLDFAKFNHFTHQPQPHFNCMYLEL